MVTGWDKTGPQLYYVDNDATRINGNLFAVGSGSTFAYGVLDSHYREDLTDDEAIEVREGQLPTWCTNRTNSTYARITHRACECVSPYMFRLR
jgi:20S proteasome alpha/beta subunit